jgi:hypothetical protein
LEINQERHEKRIGNEKHFRDRELLGAIQDSKYCTDESDGEREKPEYGENVKQQAILLV